MSFSLCTIPPNGQAHCNTLSERMAVLEFRERPSRPFQSRDWSDCAEEYGCLPWKCRVCGKSSGHRFPRRFPRRQGTTRRRRGTLAARRRLIGLNGVGTEVGVHFCPTREFDDHFHLSLQAICFVYDINSLCTAIPHMCFIMDCMLHTSCSCVL